jgi:hypothetical protein
MNFDLTALVGVIALLVMLFNLYSVVSLRKQIPGGVIGKRWGMMIWLVALFTAGYGILPFVSALSIEMLRLIVSLIFFFGALYVMITLRLIAGVIRELMS